MSPRHNCFVLLSRFVAVSVALIAACAYSNAAVQLVRDYHLRQPHTRDALFAMTVTPEQDLLSFVASKDGKWRLSRTRGWLDQQPTELTITIPGLVWGGSKEWFIDWTPRLLVSADGRYLVCVAAGIRSRSYGGKAVGAVSVVDLREFRLLTTMHIEDLPEFASISVAASLDQAGHLVLQAENPLPRRPGDNPLEGGLGVEIGLFALPTLASIDPCHYSSWQRNGALARREGEHDCAALLKKISDPAPSLAEFLNGLQGGDEKQKECQPPALLCSRYTSRDGRLARTTAGAMHRGFWGFPVYSRRAENLSR
jgi:hypothetical protein